MDYDDYESLPTSNFGIHMTAGAIAGVLEHCVMYPLDSVKTRMQSLYHAPPGTSIWGTFTRMVQQEGILRPMRGLSAVVMGAGPAHAFYFASYEYMKDKLGRLGHQKHNTLVYGTSGCVATVIHDAISNPTEVVKQRMQMHNSQHRSVLKCIAQVYREEGFRAFYRSYTTQLTMNIPFQSIHFITYEFFINQTNPERTYNPMAHMISGGIAGASAAAATTPLDVCKTLLNTEARNRGMIDALKTVYRLAGPFGYFKGIQARVLYQMPAAAICWSTYEFFKYLLIDRYKIDHDKIPPPDKTSGLVGKNSSKDVMSLSDKLSLRLVLPQASVSADTNTEVSGTGVTRSGPDNNEVLGLKPRELPVISGANLYGSLNLNTRHVDDSATNTRIRTGNFMDMRQS